MRGLRGRSVAADREPDAGDAAGGKDRCPVVSL